MTVKQGCPACGWRVYEASRQCGSCEIYLPEEESGITIDPLVQAMWHAHSKQQQQIRVMVSVIAWVVVIFAALSLIGGFIWYSAVVDGFDNGF